MSNRKTAQAALATIAVASALILAPVATAGPDRSDLNTDIPVWQPGLSRMIQCSGYTFQSYRDACLNYEIEPVYR